MLRHPTVTLIAAATLQSTNVRGGMHRVPLDIHASAAVGSVYALQTGCR